MAPQTNYSQGTGERGGSCHVHGIPPSLLELRSRDHNLPGKFIPTVPIRRFPARLNCLMDWGRATVAGIPPSILFHDKFSTWSESGGAKVAGITPVMLFSDKSSFSSEGEMNNAGGRVPVNLLSDKSSSCKQSGSVW